MVHPTRRYRNVRGSFNKSLESVMPDINFNFQEAEFETAQLNRWIEINYISRTFDVKSSIIVQIIFYAKDDRFGVKVEELCDQALDYLCGETGSNDLKALPVRDWFDASPVKPIVGAFTVKPRQVNKPVVDTYGVTNISVTVELKMARM